MDTPLKRLTNRIAKDLDTRNLSKEIMKSHKLMSDKVKTEVLVPADLAYT
jgi:hypothetical protein